LTAVFLLLTPSVYSQELSDFSKKAVISGFEAYKSVPNEKTAASIYAGMEEQLKSSGMRLEKAVGSTLKERLEYAKKNGAGYLIEGYYRKSEDGTLNIYGQIYDPQTGRLIDAFNRTYDFPELGNLKLDKKEMGSSDEKIIEEFSQKTVKRILTNPKRTERRENINDFVASQPIGKDMKIEVPPEDVAKASEEVFRIIGEDNSISIVSKRVGQSETAGKTSAIVTVLSKQKIQDSGARNLADLLKQVPGIEVFYDQFGYYKASFRGVRSKSGVLLLLDGQRINNFYDGSTFLDLRADAIEKVEIIRGPGSSVHGTNAFVGVINVVTRSSFEGKSFTQVSTRVGAENTLEPSVFFGSRIDENWKVSGYAEKFASDRRRTHLKNDSTCNSDSWSKLNCSGTVLPLPLNSGITTNDRKDQTNLFLNVDRKDNFFLKGKAVQEKRGPHVGEIGQVVPESEIGFRLFLGSVGFQKIEITDNLSISAKLYGDMYERKDDIQVERKDALRHPGFSARKMNSYIYETHGTESILQWNARKNLVVLLGAMYERLILRDFEIKKNYLRSDTNTLLPVFFDYDYARKEQIKDRHIKAVFGQAIYDPFSWMSLTFGVRYDEYSDFGKTVNPKTSAVVTPFENTQFGTLSFKFLLGSAFRAPTFQELYDQTQAYQAGGGFGNRKLKPETIQTAEIGMDYITPYRPLSFQLNGFYNSVKNNIAALNNSGTFPSERDNYNNLRGVRIGGVEAEIRLSYSLRNYIFLNGSWFQAQDYGGFPPNTGKDSITFLLDVPQARANFGINWEITRYFTLNNTVWMSSERRSNSRFAFETQSDRSFRIPQYHIWNISLASTEDLWSRGTFRLNIFNALDYKNYDDSNYAIPAFTNRSIPSAFQYGRYAEFKISCSL
ncbi:MAG TPA: TonB-dependent receptor, partial [Leptospiraceae bacterium]|nr:TonB-dependent receptor [Leptospiraceae bacterium]